MVSRNIGFQFLGRPCGLSGRMIAGWEERNITPKKKKSKHNIFLRIGILITGLSFGTLYSLVLTRINYYIMLSVFVVVYYYSSESLAAHHNNTPLPKHVVVAGYLGIFLISLFIGIQTIVVPYGNLFIILGLILIVISQIESIKHLANK